MPPALRDLSDDLLGEAFLRLPPDNPTCLLHAALCCKRWHRILADPAFRSRHRDRHRTPSILGFLRIAAGEASSLVPINPASGRPAARDLPGRVVLDCRHGLVLLLAPSPLVGANLNYDLVVWEQRCLPRLSAPPLTKVSRRFFNAAVFCSPAVDTMCHGAPFRVAIFWRNGLVMYARLYSSETDNWSEAISVQMPPPHATRLRLLMPLCRNILIGDTLYFHYSFNYAVEYQLGAQRLSFIEGPPRPVSQVLEFFMMPMEGGGLGCMTVEEDESSLSLRLWSREAASGSDGVARWTRGRAIDLEELLPDGAIPSPRLPSGHHSRFWSLSLKGFVEGTDVIFVGTPAHKLPCAIYMVQFNSGRTRKVFDKCNSVFPYTSFCIPVTDTSSTPEGPGDDASHE